MPRARRIKVKSRIVPAATVAQRLGHDPSWFFRRRSALEAKGFPKRDELLGGWDLDAIEHWLDRRNDKDDDLSGMDLDEELGIGDDQAA